MNFFKDCHTVSAIKQEYHRLVRIHHPDVGGDHETMVELNAQYQAALEAANGETSTGSDGEEHTYYYNEARETAMAEKLQELVLMQLPGIEIMVVGNWIWVSGDTKPVAKQLGKKGAKLRWHSKRLMWYWRPFGRKAFYNKNSSFDDLCYTYGVRKVKNQPPPKRAKLSA